MTQEIRSNGKITIQLFDWFSFLIVCFILSNFGKTDPGEMLFLFVYENFVMFFAFYVFVVLATPIHSMFVLKKSIVKDFDFFTNNFLTIVIFGFIAMLIAFIPFIFLNQLTLEFVSEFFKSNNYDFKSNNLFEGQEIFIDKWKEFENLFHVKFKFIFALFFFRYLLLLTLNFLFHPKFKEDSSVSVLGVYRLISNVLLAPITILISMILLVILTAIFGKATWIVLFSIAVFKLLFNLLSNRLSRFLESI